MVTGGAGIVGGGGGGGGGVVVAMEEKNVGICRDEFSSPQWGAVGQIFNFRKTDGPIKSSWI
jgi:hypothetical protein